VQGFCKPGEVARFVDQRPTAHLADFVDAVAEGERAILDGNSGMREREIASIHKSDSAHGPAFCA